MPRVPGEKSLNSFSALYARLNVEAIRGSQVDAVAESLDVCVMCCVEEIGRGARDRHQRHAGACKFDVPVALSRLMLDTGVTMGIVVDTH